MKVRLIIFTLLFTVIYTAKTQTPQSFNYQCVVRNAIGEIEANKLVAFKISILKGSATGNVVYAETQNKVTNNFGLVTMNIGEGTVLSGSFTDIIWSDDTYFMKVEFDIDGGSNFIFMGTSQLLSVPYSLYADKAGNVEDDHDKDSTNEIQTISKTDSIVTLSNNGGSFIDSDKQKLSLNGNQLTISSGNTITFTGAVDLDADPTNELQNLNLHNDTLNISQGNAVVFAHDDDRDSTNELQSLSYNNDTIFLSKTNSIVLPNDIDVDFDSTNELQTITRNGLNVTLSKNGGTFNVADNDNDSLNEIQTLAFSNDTLFLSKSNSVKLSIPPAGGSFTLSQIGSNFNFMDSVSTDANNIWPLNKFNGYYDFPTAGNQITKDLQGNTYVILSFKDTVKINGTNYLSSGGYDVMVIKKNNLNQVIWVKNFGSTSDDYFYSIKTDASNNPYIVGFASANINFGTFLCNNKQFLFKMDPLGNIQWGATWNPYGFYTKNFTIDNSNNVYIINLSINNILEYNSSGTLLNSTSMSIPYADFLTEIVQMEIDNQSGNLFIAGTGNNSGQNYSHPIISKFNSSGTNLWYQSYQSYNVSYEGYGTSMCMDNNYIYFCGYQNAGGIIANSFISKYPVTGSGRIWFIENISTDGSYYYDLKINNNKLIAGFNYKDNVYLGEEAHLTSTVNSALNQSNGNPVVIEYDFNGSVQKVTEIKSISGMAGPFIAKDGNENLLLINAFGAFYNQNIKYPKGVYLLKE